VYYQNIITRFDKPDASAVVKTIVRGSRTHLSTLRPSLSSGGTRSASPILPPVLSTLRLTPVKFGTRGTRPSVCFGGTRSASPILARFLFTLRLTEKLPLVRSGGESATRFGGRQSSLGLVELAPPSVSEGRAPQVPFLPPSSPHFG
jgi:hypothetical protein